MTCQENKKIAMRTAGALVSGLPLLLMVLLIKESEGSATCLDSFDSCPEKYGPGSVCRDDGICTVPELEMGCL